MKRKDWIPIKLDGNINYTPEYYETVKWVEPWVIEEELYVKDVQKPHFTNTTLFVLVPSKYKDYPLKSIKEKYYLYPSNAIPIIQNAKDGLICGKFIFTNKGGNITIKLK